MKNSQWCHIFKNGGNICDGHLGYGKHMIIMWQQHPDNNKLRHDDFGRPLGGLLFKISHGIWTDLTDCRREPERRWVKLAKPHDQPSLIGAF
jgi:hypothetical protein